MNNRIKELRKYLNLTLDSFGKRLGVGKSTLSQIENGKSGVTEQMIKSICREFNVDYIWLTTGEGEMFMDEDFLFMDKINRIMYGEDEVRKNLFKSFLKASDEDLMALDRILDSYIEIKNQQKKKTDS